MSRARVLLLNAALGPLDYRVPHGMDAEPGSIVLPPLGPRQLAGVVWDPSVWAMRRSNPLRGLYECWIASLRSQRPDREGCKNALLNPRVETGNFPPRSFSFDEPALSALYVTARDKRATAINSDQELLDLWQKLTPLEGAATPMPGDVHTILHEGDATPLTRSRL